MRRCARSAPSPTRAGAHCGWAFATTAQLKILSECAQAGLPEPQFRCDGWLWLTFRKDIFTEEYLQSLGLNERQIRAVLWAKREGSISNRQYRELGKVSNKTAYLELSELVQKGLLLREGSGQAIRYILAVHH